MPESADRVHREVVSFVRRSARMNPSQERAWAAHAERWVLPVPRREMSTSVAEDARLDWTEVFGRRAPLVVEIGSGRGESLVALASAHPERDHVAFEVYEPAVASTLSALARAGVENVRLVVADGAQALDRLVAAGELHELWTFFPDPWHKARHHKRRLVSPALADLAAARLVPGGRWRLATDWPDYGAAMREVLDVHPAFEDVSDGRWAERPVTKYEARGLAAGRPVIDLTYRRLP